MTGKTPSNEPTQGMNFERMKRFINHRSAITFFEIMIAMFILAIAVIPIFWVIQKGTEETDVMASQSFAINKATEILNTLLDNVPFEVIREGAPAGLLSFEGLDKTAAVANDYKGMGVDVAYVQKMSAMLFPGCEKITDKSWRCLGVINDPRGISYRATLLVNDLVDTSGIQKPEQTSWGVAFPEINHVTFSFCKNPSILEKSTWRINDFEWNLPNQIGVPPEADNMYKEGDFTSPTVLRFPTRLAADKVNYVDDENLAYCSMKRLIIEIQWNLDKGLYKKPEVLDKQTQRVHLMTLKADINR